MLANAIRHHLQSIYKNSSEDWTIVVQIILNMEGLGKKLVACKIIGSVSDLSLFGVGFNRAQSQFCIIDVGQGKERADYKVREAFRLFSRMPQCKHLYFGPCHDSGYVPLLEPYHRDAAYQSKVTLIETTKAEPGFLPFQRIKLGTIFRSEALPARPNPNFSAHTPPVVATMPLSSTAGMPPPSNSQTSSPQLAQAAHPAPSSWAAMSKSGASTGKTIDITPAKKAPRKHILLNSNYDRLDEPLPPVQQQYVKKFNERIRDKNCCNNYHLKGFCSNGDGCNFQHGDRLSDGEQRVLRHKARSIKCNSGSWCEEFDCPYGHRCKFGGKDCSNDECRFFDTHHVDPVGAPFFFFFFFLFAFVQTS